MAFDWGALAQGVSGLVGSLANIGTTSRQKSLMDYQTQKQQELSEWNYLNSASLQKQGLRNAGISTAGFSDSTISSNGSTASAGAMPSSDYQGSAIGQPLTNGLAGLGKLVADTRKSNADARSQEIENEYKSGLLGTELEFNQTMLNQAQELLPLNVANAQQDLINKQREYDLKGYEIKKVQKDIEQVSQLIENMKVEKSLTQAQISEVGQKVQLLLKENKIKEVASTLAHDFGIIVDADGYTNILSVLLGGYGPAVAEALAGSIGDLIHGASSTTSTLIKSIFPLGVFEKFKSALDEGLDFDKIKENLDKK